MCRRWLWLLLLGWVSVASATPLTLMGNEPLELAGHLEWLPTAQPNLTIETVASGRAGAFQPLAAHFINQTGGPRDAWLRFTLELGPDGPAKTILRVMPPLLDHVELYEPWEGGWHKSVAGSQLPLAQWPIRDRTSAFPIHLSMGSSRTYYLHFQQDGLLNAYLILYPPDAFHQVQIRETLAFGLYFGIFLSLVLINLLHWATLRENLFGELSLFFFLRGAFFFSFNGLAFQYLFPEYPLFNKALMQSMLAWTIASHILLSVRVLNLPLLYPRLSRLFIVCGLAALVASVTVWFGLFTHLMAVLLLMLLMIGGLAVVIAADQMRRGHPLGRMLLGIMLLALICQWAAALPALGIHWGMSADLYGGQIGALFIALSVHIAVAMRALELKKARTTSEQAARLAAEQAESERTARREQADFVSMLFHEIKTPLAEISSATTVLETLDQHPSRSSCDRYDTIHSAVDRLNQLVEKSLTRDRQGLDGSHLTRHLMSLQQLAERVLESFRWAREHRLQLESSDELPLIYGDSELLRVALANLIDNAIKYTPAGGSIAVQLGREGSCQFVAVRDSGPGIDEQGQGRAFDRYWRGTPASGVAGAGLGLYLVKKIVQAHGGEMRVESQPGFGSRFVAMLPEALTRCTPSPAVQGGEG